ISKLEAAFRSKMGDDKFVYRKGNPDIYSLLQKYGREDLAKRFARKLRSLYSNSDYATQKPCTRVDELVEELEHPESLLSQSE
ncbi:MAG: RloB domain-containing protein, partial [Bacteroidales bacterium]|nr:RloB domain-containing protein [Bacteroidales bacterium]